MHYLGHFYILNNSYQLGFDLSSASPYQNKIIHILFFTEKNTILSKGMENHNDLLKFLQSSLIRVVFPEPLSPKSAKTSPSFTSNEMASIAKTSL